MGCFPGPKSSSCSCDHSLRRKILDVLNLDKPPSSSALPNPDPTNFVIKQVVEVGSHLVARICYPDCKNYEGDKIMVYEGITLEHLESAKRLDPHFCDKPSCISPVARFVPTMAGWAAAELLAKLLERLKGE